jgi:hypothetical protein
LPLTFGKNILDGSDVKKRKQAWLHIELPVSDLLSPQFYEQQATMVQNLYIYSIGAFLASEGKTKIPEVILYR